MTSSKPTNFLAAAVLLASVSVRTTDALAVGTPQMPPVLDRHGDYSLAYSTKLPFDLPQTPELGTLLADASKKAAPAVEPLSEPVNGVPDKAVEQTIEKVIDVVAPSTPKDEPVMAKVVKEEHTPVVAKVEESPAPTVVEEPTVVATSVAKVEEPIQDTPVTKVISEAPKQVEAVSTPEVVTVASTPEKAEVVETVSSKQVQVEETVHVAAADTAVKETPVVEHVAESPVIHETPVVESVSEAPKQVEVAAPEVVEEIKTVEVVDEAPTSHAEAVIEKTIAATPEPEEVAAQVEATADASAHANKVVEEVTALSTSSMPQEALSVGTETVSQAPVEAVDSSAASEMLASVAPSMTNEETATAVADLVSDSVQQVAETIQQASEVLGQVVDLAFLL